MSTWSTSLPSSNVHAGDADHAGIHNKTTSALAEVRNRVAGLTRDEPGYYIPAGWGANWRAKRDAAAAGNGLASVTAVGTSITQGFHASDALNKSYMGLIKNGLQAQFGDGGSGFFSTVRSPEFIGAGVAVTAWGAIPGTLTTTTGTWTVGGSSFGPGSLYLSTGTTGNSITFTVRGTNIRIYTLTSSAGTPWTYSIDGGAPVAGDGSGAASTTVRVTSVTAGPGEHTVKLTSGSSTNNLYVCGVTGENASGVVVNNMGRSAAHASHFSSTTPESGTANWSGGPDYPADLVIYDLAVNDANDAISGDSWAAYLRNYLQSVKDGTSLSGSYKATGQTDVLIALQHVGKHDATHIKYQDYAARARGIAASYGAAVVDLWAIGRNSWNYWDTFGRWADLSNMGAAGTDRVHLSDAGHQYVADIMLPVLTA
ncbi:GDSL-type esterase/lipase family protein [Streptomyces sp. NPDC002698]|uniref:GDSL-type esterase/lipase family protein n=1 Tax=Streptomyces sp. NPDC002698 TaxID=3364660 RepID=UPI0036A9E56F